jgi:hypothetical protein
MIQVTTGDAQVSSLTAKVLEDFHGIPHEKLDTAE